MTSVQPEALTRPPRHMIQLDGVRGIAVIGPILTHYLPADHVVNRVASWGDMGVNLFFVLSGFLITDILLRCRALIEDRTQGVGASLGRFYIRRALRILPLFYGVLLVLYLLDLEHARQWLAWHWFYLSNFGMVIENRAFAHTTHFWSLAVEEQFYLFWPLLVLLVPRRWLVRVMVLTVIAAPLSRFVMALLPIFWQARRVLPWCCLDALALGGLLAAWRSGGMAGPGTERARRVLTRLGLWVGGPVMVALVALEPMHAYASAANVLLGRLAQSLFFIWLIDRAADGFGGAAGRMLASGPLTYIGRVSYGVYVLHPLVPVLLVWMLGERARLADVSPWGRLAAWSAVTLLLASVSWFAFEKPINLLKSRFPYRVAAG